MPRRVEEKHTGGERIAGNRLPSTVLAGSGCWSRRGSALNTRNANSSVLDHHTRETPRQPALTPARSSHGTSAPTSTRKISASFSTDCPLSSRPTIACSAVTASTTMNHPGPLTSHPVNRYSTISSSRSHGNMDATVINRKLKTSHTYSNLPMPAAQYRAPSYRPPAATAHIAGGALHGRDAENMPPSISMASLSTNTQSAFTCPTPKLVPKPSPPKKKGKSRLGMPKSRTFNVFSNLTASLSRTSLGQFTGSDLRQASTPSKSTPRKDPAPYMNSQSASSNSSQTVLSPTVETADPHQIHTAQSSAYWSGRFMSLQDRFQSETLISENLTTLVHAHAQRSLLSVVQPSLASSATMSCIVPISKPNPKPTQPATISMSPSKRQPRQKQSHESRAGVTPETVGSTTAAAPAQPSYEATAALLLNEDNRARRIFSYLDMLCTTSEARISLRQWQQAYARRMGKESLLPEGGTMQEKNRELTWVGRLLIRNGSGHSKRGSLGF